MEAKLISNLINRLAEKLSHKDTKDKIYLELLSAIKQLAPYRINLILRSLLNLYENTLKFEFNSEVVNIIQDCLYANCIEDGVAVEDKIASALMIIGTEPIIRCLSVMNYESILSKLRKLNDEDLELTRIISACDFNHKRLSLLLVEFGKRKIPLRKAVWNWIDQYPAEFAHHHSGKRMLEIPEAMYEVFQHKNKNFGQQTCLYLMTPCTVADKRLVFAYFIETMKHAVGKPAQTQALVDVYKASIHFNDPNLKIHEIEAMLIDKVFLSQNDFDQKIKIDVFVTSVLRNKTILGIFLEDTFEMKMILIKGLFLVVQKNPTVAYSLAGQVRLIFLSCDKKQKELSAAILQLYQKDFRMAIYSENPHNKQEEIRLLVLALAQLEDSQANEIILNVFSSEEMTSNLILYWLVSSQLIQKLKLNKEQMGFLLKLLRERNECIKTSDQLGSDIPDRFKATTRLEACLLTELCSSDYETNLLAVDCLKELVDECQMAEDRSVVVNLDAYKSLEGDITGKVFLTRKIRKIFRSLKQSDGVKFACKDVYARWLLKSDDWLNYTAFLLAAGGFLDNYVDFIKKLFNEHLKLDRENLRELIGTETNPQLFVVILKQFPTDFTEDPEDYIVILRHIIDRLQSPLEADLNAIVLGLMKSIHRGKLKLKLRMIQLLESIFLKRDFLNIREEIKFRNQIVKELILEWNEEDEKFELQLLKTINCLIAQLPLSGDEEQKSRSFQRYFQYFVQKFEKKELRETSISCLSNLLSNNVDVGLKYSLSVGYSEDLRVRQAFVQVLCNILYKGVEFVGSADLLLRLNEFILDRNLVVLLSLAETCTSDVDDLSQLLVDLLKPNKNLLLSLIYQLIEKEVLRTESSANLFRRNSICTKMISCFAKEYAGDYLKLLVDPIFRIRAIEEKTYEIDPLKILPNENQQKNTSNLKWLCSLFLDRIFEFQDAVPVELLYICSFITRSVEKYFPNTEKTQLVGGFLFLRLINPYILSMETQNSKRGLLLVTKIIQNLSNGVLFGGKEDYMKELNQYIQGYTSKVQAFLTRLYEVPVPDLSDLALIQIEDENSLYKLHKFLCENFDELSKEVLKKDVEMRKMLDSLSRILAQIPQRKRQELDENTLEMFKQKKFLYQERKFVYFIARRVSNMWNPDQLSSFIVSEMRQQQREYILILDLTLFSEENEFTSEQLNRFYSMVSQETRQNCQKILVYNCNTHFRRYLKKIGKMINTRKIVFLNSLAEFGDYIHLSELQLPKSTLSLEKDLQIFAPASMKSAQIAVRINSESVHLTSLKKLDILNSSSGIINDVVLLTDIDDIKTSNEDVTIIVRRNMMTFSCNKKDKIIQLLNRNKDKLVQMKNKQRTIRPSDLPGTLLNIALLNLGADDLELRVSAYNLLLALSAVFNFQLELLSIKSLYIPVSQSYIVRISSELSRTDSYLTLELIRECFVGYAKLSHQMKQLAIDYILPWISNLAAAKKQDLQDLFMVLLDIKDIQRIWARVGENDELIPIALDCLTLHTTEKPNGRDVSEVVLTLSACNLFVVSGYFIARLRRALSEQQPPTDKINSLLKLCSVLSFDNRLNVERFLPDILHLSVMFLNNTVHTLIVNSFHSACTFVVRNDEKQIKKIVMMLNELSEPRYKLLFADASNLTSVETLCSYLLEGLRQICGSGTEYYEWRARWVSLAVDSSFQFGPLQPRAFVELGCLLKGEGDDEMLTQILMTLRKALLFFEENDCQLIVSIVMCMTNLLDTPVKSRFFASMFWLGFGLLQIGHLPIYQAALSMLQVIVRHCASFEDPIALLMNHKDKVFEQIEVITGVNFSYDFQFACACILLKGLRHHQTKQATINTIHLLTNIVEGFGLVLPLVPMLEYAERKELLSSLGVTEGRIFEYHPPLVIGFLATLAEHAQDSELTFLFNLLAEAHSIYPDIVQSFYDQLMPKLLQALSSPEPALISSAHRILYQIAKQTMVPIITSIPSQEYYSNDSLDHHSQPPTPLRHSTSNSQIAVKDNLREIKEGLMANITRSLTLKHSKKKSNAASRSSLASLNNMPAVPVAPQPIPNVVAASKEPSILIELGFSCMTHSDIANFQHVGRQKKYSVSSLISQLIEIMLQ